MKENEACVSAQSLVGKCTKATVGNRTRNSTEIYRYGFDCNIQQVKRAEFDILYYNFFFADNIAIFKMASEDVLRCPGFSDFQHMGNAGEGPT